MTAIAMERRDTHTLTREQELALATSWRSHGDRAAAETLIRAHLGLVKTVARKYRHYAVSHEELVAEGNLGVVRALEKFDPERRLRFATYAVYWIRSCMLDHVLRSWSLVGGGSGPLGSKVFFKLRRERIRAANFLGEGELADSAVAERLGVTTGQLAAMNQRLDVRDVSLDVPAIGDGMSPLDRLSSLDNPELELSRARAEPQVVASVQTALSGLDPRERFIAEHRLMADSADELSLAEVGRHLGVSRERARQLEERTKRKLRKRFQRAAWRS